MRVDREGPIHAEILGYLRQRFPDAAIHHSPNEVDLSGKQAVRIVTKARKRGTCRGWPDIEVFVNGRALFFEVKAEGGRTSMHQKLVGRQLASNGALWAVVRSRDDVREYLTEWGMDEHSNTYAWTPIADPVRVVVQGVRSGK